VIGYLQRWLEDPDGGRRFEPQRDKILAHGLDCPGLAHVWVPRKGGVTCLSDVVDCDGCGVTFFWEAMYAPEKECAFTDHSYCACCLTEECDCTE